MQALSVVGIFTIFPKVHNFSEIHFIAIPYYDILGWLHLNLNKNKIVLYYLPATAHSKICIFSFIEIIKCEQKEIIVLLSNP